MYDRVVPTPSRLLVVRLGAIGDCLRVLPAVARLAEALPQTKIGWVVEQWAEPVLRGHPLVSRFHILDRRALKAGPRKALREIARLHEELVDQRYDVAIDFHARLKSGLVTWGSGAPVRIGFGKETATEANHRFTNLHVSARDPWENRVVRHLRLLAPLGVRTSYEAGDTGLWLDPTEVERAKVWHAEAGSPAIAVFPGTSLHRRSDRWPVGKWTRALRELAADGHRAVVFWGPAERELATELARAADDACTLAPATTLPQMMAMLGRFRLYVGANTAALHMAWMQGVPSVVLLGGRPERTDAPLPPARSVILSAAPMPPQQKLRGEAAIRAIEDIPVEQVVSSARTFL